MDTRSKKTAQKYAHEIDNNYHKKLIKTLLNTKGHKLLSAYDHDLYNELIDNGWTKQTLNTTVRVTRSQNRPTLQRTECLFCSPFNFSAQEHIQQ
jgi:site-specific DNA-adenine methylase